MALYTPKAFVAPSLQASLALVAAQPFATLITSLADRPPHITHLPLLWSAGGESGVLSGHMARANPHWQAFAQGHTVAVFHGPHAYISPSWYAQPEREVPTWNYATVHAQGQPLLVEEREAKLAMIDALTAQFEAGLPTPWTRSLAPERLAQLLDATVAFRIPLQLVEGKFKMNQNKTPADRAKVIDALTTLDDAQARAVADWMRAHD
ncbi:MAG TPA: FMN-binding negative transcriptional regulator [Fontimonas sp.]